MVIARYFLYVGSALLAGLYAIDTLVPQDAVTTGHSAGGIDKSTVRIHSLQKLPERVVFDTSLPTIVPPASAVEIAAAPPPPSADPNARDTYAEYVPPESKKPENRSKHARADQAEAPKKRRVARAHIQYQQRSMYAYAQQPMMFGQRPMRVAQQQQRFGFFGGGPSWGTW